MLKKRGGLWMALAMMLFVGVSHAGEKIRIGHIVKDASDNWFQLEWAGAEKAAEKYGFELRKVEAKDGQIVLNTIDTFASVGVQGFIICTPDPKLGPSIRIKARSLGLKLMSVDDQLVGADGKALADIPFLGISARNIGRTVGREMAKEAKRRGWDKNNWEGAALALMTIDILETARERYEGAAEALVEAGFPASQIHRSPLADGKYDSVGGFDAMSIVLTQNPTVKHWMVTASNDPITVGAVRALEGHNFNADTAMGIGINGGAEAQGEFQKSARTPFFGSVLLSSFFHGFQPCEMMYKWITEGTPPPMDTRTEGAFMTRENWQEVLEESTRIQ